MVNIRCLIQACLGFVFIPNILPCVAAEPFYVGMNSVNVRQGFISYIYGAGEERKLVVLFEKDDRRFELPLARAGFTPVSYKEKIFVVDSYGFLNAYSVDASGIHPEKEVVLTTNAVRAVECNPSLGIIFFVETAFSERRTTSSAHEPVYNLTAYDLNGRERLWSRRLKRPGVIATSGKVVCVISEDEVEVFEAGDGKQSKK